MRLIWPEFSWNDSQFRSKTLDMSLLLPLD